MAEGLQAYAEEDITVAASAIGLSSSNLFSSPPPDQVELFVTLAQLRFRTDGTDPTAGVGEILNPFDRYTLTDRNDMLNFRAIRVGGTSANLRARYRRQH